MKKTLQIAFVAFAILVSPTTVLAQDISSVVQEADLPDNARPGRVLCPRADSRTLRDEIRTRYGT